MGDAQHASTLTRAAESFARRLWAFVYGAARRSADWVSDRRYADEHARLLDEIEARGELETLVELTGATREQLRSGELSPLAAFELLHHMMERLGIDTKEAMNQVDVTTEAQWHCRLCENWRECRHWLGTGSDNERYRGVLRERQPARSAPRPGS